MTPLPPQPTIAELAEAMLPETKALFEDIRLAHELQFTVSEGHYRMKRGDATVHHGDLLRFSSAARDLQNLLIRRGWYSDLLNDLVTEADDE